MFTTPNASRVLLVCILARINSSIQCMQYTNLFPTKTKNHAILIIKFLNLIFRSSSYPYPLRISMIMFQTQLKDFMVKLESSALSKRCIVLSSATEVNYLNPIPKVFNKKNTA